MVSICIPHIVEQIHRLVGSLRQIYPFLCVLQMFFIAFDKEADIDVLNHPILNFIYYLVGPFGEVFRYLLISVIQQ
jgi:hypothetical protein